MNSDDLVAKRQMLKYVRMKLHAWKRATEATNSYVMSGEGGTRPKSDPKAKALIDAEYATFDKLVVALEVLDANL